MAQMNAWDEDDLFFHLFFCLPYTFTLQILKTFGVTSFKLLPHMAYIHTYDDEQHILEFLCLYLIWTIIIFCFVFCTLSPRELSVLGKNFGLLPTKKTSPAKFQKQNDDVICFVKIAARVSAHGIHDTKLYNIHIFQFGAIFEQVWDGVREFVKMRFSLTFPQVKWKITFASTFPSDNFCSLFTDFSHHLYLFVKTSTANRIHLSSAG